MVSVIFIAPPAAGKGTISDYLVNNFSYEHISTGDILRNVSKEDTEMGHHIATLMKEGQFIGDDIILPLFKEELLKIKEKPFILDGIPRNLEQAKFLEQLFLELGVDNYVVINMEMDEHLLEKRAVGRRVCDKCKASYNIYFEGFKPKVENTCDKCNALLIERPDDALETFRNRYETYLQVTSPLIHFYENKGRLKKVDASKPQEEMIKEITFILKGEKND